MREPQISGRMRVQKAILFHSTWTALKQEAARASEGWYLYTNLWGVIIQKSGNFISTAVCIYSTKKWHFQQQSYWNLQYPRRVKDLTALLCESTVTQKSGTFNSNHMEIYSNPEERKLQQYGCGNLQHPRRVEASTALLWKYRVPQTFFTFLYQIPETQQIREILHSKL